MTEQHWLRSGAPLELLDKVRETASLRKLRLVSVGFCRCQWADLDETSRFCVERGEQLADGLIDSANLSRLHVEALRHFRQSGMEHDPRGAFLAHAAMWTVHDLPWYAARFVSSLPQGTDLMKPVSGGRRLHADLIRDIFGNPFRPMSLNRAWLTSDVLALARGIYDERAFDRMPILADALQDAGCDNADVLNHCRGDAVHVRGCWVVDLILGKA